MQSFEGQIFMVSTHARVGKYKIKRMQTIIIWMDIFIFIIIFWYKIAYN